MPKGPYLPNIDALISLGINPNTKLPYKIGETASALKDGILTELRILDEQDAVRRYTWYNLPDGLDGELVERMLYYRGQLMFYYDDITESFYMLPFTQDQSPDVYGRFVSCRPQAFGNAADEKKTKTMGEVLSRTTRKVQHSIQLDEVTYEDMTSKCVILYDYCKQLANTILPRARVQEPILDIMSRCIPYMRTNLVASTGIRGVRVDNADASESVDSVSKSIERKSLNGEQFVAITSPIELQELANGSMAKPQDYMLAMQSLDNFRLGLYGLENGGLFEKKAHELQAEADINSGTTALVYQDGLMIRQNFCNIVNSIWGLGIWCDASESVLGQDHNGDGLDYDVEQSNGGQVDDGSEEI